MKRQSIATLSLALIATLLLSGCQAPGRFAWNDYDHNLYKYHDQSLTQDEYMERLLGAEKETETRHVKMGPGLYAEISTQYLRRGKKAEALQYYKKEGDTWAQAKPFMDALIAGLQRQSGDKSTASDAPAAPATTPSTSPASTPTASPSADKVSLTTQGGQP